MLRNVAKALSMATVDFWMLKSKDWTSLRHSSLYAPADDTLNADYGKDSVGAETRGLARTG